MSTFAERKPRNNNPTCPRCNAQRNTVEIILQARSTKRPRPGSLASRGRRYCETCALAVYEQMERILDGYTE